MEQKFNLKKRIVDAIKVGKNDTRTIMDYLEEECGHCEAWPNYTEFCKAIAQLLSEGVIVFTSGAYDDDYYVLA